MGIYDIFVIALALSLDAFGVMLCISINEEIKLKNKLSFAISFAFFQFLFAFIGGYGGFLFTRYIMSMPKIIGGFIISLVGVLMIKEGFQKKQECIFCRKSMYCILGISVSIDALVVGFTTLNFINNLIILMQMTLIIGVVTLFMCVIGITISKYIKKIAIISEYADYIGGFILILFGIKMILF
ncbi:hypothetical protein FDF74_08250 [Clostridium niameyense]|uniref:Putative manganese efflux pump MntP n=1 Tax=Clostridium niameyense TaxID=1622073 RepID=A0A6M0RC70_9CLOT|nr:manganese efflux pump [Clostridium niameyense]NEZ47199.1 hypothetical protein [Clostridium niameyense]